MRLCSVQLAHLHRLEPTASLNRHTLSSSLKLFLVTQVTQWRGELLSFQCDPGQQRACSKQLTVLPAKLPAQIPSSPTYLLQTNRRSVSSANIAAYDDPF